MPGDGIGPEVVAAALRVLDELILRDDLDLELLHLPNSAAHYRATGVVLDEETVNAIESCDALLFGAAGVDDLPGVLEKGLILGLIQKLNLAVGVRSAFLHHSDLSPIKGLGRGDVDCVIVRDSAEGEMAVPGGALHPGTEAEVAIGLTVHSHAGVTRTLRFAFELAQQRRRRLSVVVQANAITAHGVWSRCLHELAEEYPDVDAEELLPDHAAMKCLTRPQDFDVIASTLLIGGILVDLVGSLVGGIGLVASSRLNPNTGFGMFEPAHGSAPKYAGKNVASPIATISALSMLLEHLGEQKSADRIKVAVDQCLATKRIPGVSTRSGMSTTAATDVLLAAL